jgi:uncharacterized membrane protein YcaP (DUF421 family)
MEVEELLYTALRAVAVFVLMLAVIRLLGKRTIGNFTAFDLLVALMLGEIVDEVIYGDVMFIQGAVAILVIALAKYATGWLSYWDHGFDKLLEGAPSMIVKHGEFYLKGMREEQMNEKEVLTELRLNGINDMREVKFAFVESNGDVSVIKEEWAETLQKADLDKELKKEMEKALGGDEDSIPEDKDTTATWALKAS